MYLYSTVQDTAVAAPKNRCRLPAWCDSSIQGCMQYIIEDRTYTAAVHMDNIDDNIDFCK